MVLCRSEGERGMIKPPQGVIYDENGRDNIGFAWCGVCGCPYEGLKCGNPGCDSNRSADKIAHDAGVKAKRDAEEAIRAKIRAIRAMNR